MPPAGQESEYNRKAIPERHVVGKQVMAELSWVCIRRRGGERHPSWIPSWPRGL